MTIPPIATIRSSPKVIKATEFYHMQLDLVSHVQSSTIEKHGQIEINVPYDGNVYVTKESTEDLTSQIRYKHLPRRARALIGYLNFQNHSKTNLDTQYNLSLHNDILPIDIGLNERGLRYLDSLREDKFEQYSEVRYEPNELPASPLSLEFFITDEILPAYFKKYDMPKFQKHLYLGFNIVLSLAPAQMEMFKDEELALSDFRMDWISIPTTERISATRTGFDKDGNPVPQNTAVFYDAETQQVVCPKIKLIRNELKNQYSTTLILQVPEPIEIYKEKIFTGTVQLKFPFLISGLNLKYYKTNGQLDSDFEIKRESKFLLKFRLNILKNFQNKRHVPSQLLQFPRVILDAMRVYDIETILRDEGFQEISQYPEDFANETAIEGRVELYAEREEGFGLLRLRIMLDGKKAQTEREKVIPGDEKFVTKFDTGGFECRIQGELNQDSRTVVNLINKIHNIMKERFHHVSVLD